MKTVLKAFKKIFPSPKKESKRGWQRLWQQWAMVFFNLIFLKDKLAIFLNEKDILIYFLKDWELSHL